jgi:hypothetical protein
VIKGVHDLLFAKQQVFLSLKQHLQEFMAETSQKELEHWRVQLSLMIGKLFMPKLR